MRTPVEHRALATQRQPTPRLDPHRKGHFLRCSDALNKGEAAACTLVDLTDLPSNKGEGDKAVAKARAKRDERVAKTARLKSWEGKKLRCVVTCHECGKGRGVYAPTDAAYYGARVALQQKLESVSHRFCCGDLLFDDDHPLSGILCQRQNLTCSSPMEKGYYNCPDRGLKLPDVCYHCGNGGGKQFVLGTKELRERCLTGGYNCFPICVNCLDGGKKVVTRGRKNEMEARKEKERKAQAKR